MSGFLTHKDKTQISKWMSRDSQFGLLYKLSRDGVPPQRFHELCDNKGPTVTIFYNTDNNVYGGYLSDSWGNTYFPDNWGSTGSWCTDQRAFLFKLYSAGNWKPKKFPYICGETHYQTLQELKDFVAKYEPLEEINIQEVNILLLGQVGAGKSSFINTINSIFKNELSSRACIGSEKDSITKKFEKFRIRDHSTKKYLRFRICDTRGVDEGMSIDNKDLGFILDGNLPNHYKFEMHSASRLTEGFIWKPTVMEKIHVVAFVLDRSTLDLLSKKVLTNLLVMKSLVVDREIPHVVILTSIDKICCLENDNVQKAFTNGLIETAVNNTARVIGLPRSHALPVKNYEKETRLKTNINILALTTLRRLLMFADDFLENQYYQEQENAQI